MRTGVLSDRKKHGYPSQNALRNTLACFLAGEGTPMPLIQGGIFADNHKNISTKLFFLVATKKNSYICIIKTHAS